MNIHVLYYLIGGIIVSLALVFRFIARDVYNYEKPIEKNEDFHSFYTADPPNMVCKNFKTRLEFRLDQLRKSYVVNSSFEYLPSEVISNGKLISSQCHLRSYIKFTYKSHIELVTITISAIRIGGDGQTLVSFYYE